MADARSRAASVLQTFQQAVMQASGPQVCQWPACYITVNRRKYSVTRIIPQYIKALCPDMVVLIAAAQAL